MHKENITAGTVYEDRERQATIGMADGSKADLFTQGHPIVRQIRDIPEIIFEEEENNVPPSVISLKKLFSRKQMDEQHVDFLILYKIALSVLQILKKLSGIHVYPGLVDLGELYVDLSHPGTGGVYLLHPQKFQLLHFEQDYEWYPEDERIFGDALLFDEDMQKKADTRLIYKILVASARGNVKYPPGHTEADYSALFFKALPDEWKRLFQEKEGVSHDDMEKLLKQCIEIEESFAREAKVRLDEKAEKKMQEETTALSGEKTKSGKKLFCVLALLRTELDDSRRMSKMVYQLQDELEMEASFSQAQYYQAFVFGNGSIAAREFACYEKGFRCQCEQQIREYSAGETLLIAASLVKEKMEAEPEGEYRMYALADGSLKNDRVFQAAFTMLENRKKEGMQFYLCLDEDSRCEACQRLKHLAGGQEEIHADQGNQEI